jgi:hypothetical protein
MRFHNTHRILILSIVIILLISMISPVLGVDETVAGADPVGNVDKASVGAVPADQQDPVENATPDAAGVPNPTIGGTEPSVDAVSPVSEVSGAPEEEVASSGEMTMTDACAGGPTLAANFSCMPTSGVAPLTVACTDASTGPVTDWQWLFGNPKDGWWNSESNQKNPVVTYTNPGTYTVSLQVAYRADRSVPEYDSVSNLTKTGYITVPPLPTLRSSVTPASSPPWPVGLNHRDVGGSSAIRRNGSLTTVVPGPRQDPPNRGSP